MPNIEIKAKCQSLASARLIADAIKTQYLGELHQIDTYFRTRAGKLKLREINGIQAQLIPYVKDYSFGPMRSDYTVLDVIDPLALKSLLDKTLGTVVVVDKKRTVFLVDNVRIHLDEVKNLGTFIEFEAVYQESSIEDCERETIKVHELMKQFSIHESDLLDKSYVDYLLEGEDVNNKLKTLYIFENDSFVLAEIKRLDVDQGLPPDKIFFWFLFNKKTKHLIQLEFVSMNSSGSEEQRVFKQAHLRFNQKQAFVKFDNDTIEFKLTHFLSTEFKGAVVSYLN